MAELKALCMKCKNNTDKDNQQVMNDVSVEKQKNGAYAARGVCASCGTKMFKFMKKEDAQEFLS
ncbi:MAG: DUF5679 domain-containing protein [Candidatus Paceibacterota bacterium]